MRKLYTIYLILLKLTCISQSMLLKIQHAYSVHQSFIKFAHVVCSPFWIRLWKNYAPVRPCTQDQCFYFACTLMARRVMIECSYPHPYARPSSFTYNKILERQSAVHKRLFKKKSTAWARRQQVHKKKTHHPSKYSFFTYTVVRFSADGNFRHHGRFQLWQQLPPGLSAKKRKKLIT